MKTRKSHINVPRVAAGVLAAALLAPSVALAVTDRFVNRDIVGTVTYDDRMIVYFSPGGTNRQSCGTQSNGTAVLDLDAPGAKNMLAAILVATATSKKVGIGVGGCLGLFPKIYRIDVNY